jgi:hypothetical protein
MPETCDSADDDGDPARPGALWLVAGGTLVVAGAAAVCSSVAGFFWGARLASWQGALAIAMAFAWSVGASLALRAPITRTVALSWALVGGAFAAGNVLCSHVYDLGFDSQSYHQLGIVELGNGWNPILRPEISGGAYALFVDHYSIGNWIQAALVVGATHDLEAAKVLNVLAMLATFCIWRGALVYAGMTTARLAWVIALLAALNPIAIVQATTFYVDGYLASMMASLAAVLILVVATPRPLFFTLSVAVLVLLANTKFTGVVYPLPLLAAAGFLLHRHTRARATLRKFVVSHVAGYVIAVGLAGYHPYVTNTLAHGHPFYPLRGHQASHDVAALRPPALAHVASRVERLTRSVFADAASPWRDSARIYKLPFTIGTGELELYGTPDARVGGWGPLFSGSLVLSLVGLAFFCVRRGKTRVVLSVVVTALVVSALLNAECWWARFSPQLALLPVVVATALLMAREAAERRWRALGCVLAAVTLANAGLIAVAQGFYVPRRSASLERFLRELADSHPTLYVADRWVAPLRRLREHGVAFTAVRDDGPDPDPELGTRMPCHPLHEFPGTMNEIRYCVVPAEPVALGDSPPPHAVSGQ